MSPLALAVTTDGRCFFGVNPSGNICSDRIDLLSSLFTATQHGGMSKIESRTELCNLYVFPFFLLCVDARAALFSIKSTAILTSNHFFYPSLIPSLRLALNAGLFESERVSLANSSRWNTLINTILPSYFVPVGSLRCFLPCCADGSREGDITAFWETRNTVASRFLWLCEVISFSTVPISCQSCLGSISFYNRKC